MRHQHNHRGSQPECYGCPDRTESAAPKSGMKLITFCDGPLQGEVQNVPKGSSVWVALEYDEPRLQLKDGVLCVPDACLTARQVVYHFHRFAFVIGEYGVTFWVGSLRNTQPVISDFVYSVLRPEVAAGVTIERMPPRIDRNYPW